jgi:dTDP-4-amino-4,6-dideoxygalactose transaminase
LHTTPTCAYDPREYKKVFSFLFETGAFSLQAGDEVIVPAYTFQAVPDLIQKMGLKVVFADVHPQMYTVDAAAFERLLTPRTRVFLATHILGNPCPMPEIMDVARKNNIIVIEDCAQSIGAGIHGKKVGSFGDAAIFSMETVKLMHTYGGGVITVSDEQVYKKMMPQAACLGTISVGKLMKKISFTLVEHVLTQPLIFTLVIWPWLALGEDVFSIDFEKIFKRMKRGMKGVYGGRMTNYQAAVGLIELQDLDRRIALINRNAGRLKQALACETQQKLISAAPVFFSFVIRTKSRDLLKKKLLCHGIDSGFEASQNCSSVFAGAATCDVADRLAHELLQLPLNETTSERDIFRMAEYIKKWGG